MISPAFPSFSSYPQMHFKLPFIAAVFALPVLVSGSPILPQPVNIFVISGENDEFFSSIVSTLFKLAVIPFCSHASQDSPLLSVDSDILYSVLNGRLALVRERPSALCEKKCLGPAQCPYDEKGQALCDCHFDDDRAHWGVSRVSIFRQILHWHRNHSWTGV